VSEFEALLDKHTNLPEGLLPGPVTCRSLNMERGEG